MKNTIILFAFIGLCVSLNACGQSKGKNNQSPKTMTEIPQTESDWRKKLTDEEYYILREKGTERPYTGKFLLHKEKGNYTCKGCGQILFSSDSKFDSHCGWPSFDREIKKGVIKETLDNSLGMRRIEITCGRCGSHLGHVFNDGPTNTGLRYCVNSVSLGFEKE